MPRHDQHCLACDWQATILVAAHEHPPCPSCGGPTERLWLGSASVNGDEWPGGGPRTFENMGPTPVTCATKSDYRRELKARGIEPMVRHVPVPGTDKSPHTRSWDVPCAYTLEAAKALVSRAGMKPATPAEPEMTVRGPVVTPAEIGALLDGA